MDDRRLALLLVSEFGQQGREAIPTLVESLKSENADLSWAAGEALSRIGKDSIPSLVDGLRDANAMVREHAAVALGKIGPDANNAVLSLILLLQDESIDVGAAAASALGAIGEEALTIPALITALRDESIEVRSKVIMALSQYGSAAQNAVSVLAQLLRNETHSIIRCMVIRALGDLGVAAAETVPLLCQILEEGDEMLIDATVETLGYIGAVAIVAIPALCQLVAHHPNAGTRIVAAAAISTIDPRNPIALRTLTHAASDADPETRDLAIFALKETLRRFELFHNVDDHGEVVGVDTHNLQHDKESNASDAEQPRDHS